MISIIWPYWDRQAVAERSLSLMATHYAGLDLEVIVVDDGSAEAFEVPAGLPFQVRVISLPRKDVAKNPCVPINVGVRCSLGDVLVLSGPDVLHTKPVLRQMLNSLRGPSGYVMAACRMGARWLCHSSLVRRDDTDVGSWLPRGSGYHFLSMLKPVLWYAAGRFDQDYRDGAGYDDADFVRRLDRVGAEFVLRDDLVVEHVRDGAHASWSPGSFARNRALFLSKWQPVAEAA